MYNQKTGMLKKQKEKYILNLVINREFHKLPPILSAKEKMDIRREALERITNVKLDSIGSPVFDIGYVSSRNCENLIGKTEVPLGIVGPLRINGEYAMGDFFVPLATTEGALIASVNRGCKAIFESGGAFSFIEDFGITRAPLFRTKNLKDSKEFVEWIDLHFQKIAELFQKTDSYLKLISIFPVIAGRNVFLRFSFDTADAMGMNMVTIACDNVTRNYIEKETKVPCLALSGNVCTDKKPSWINKIKKRGYSVQTDVTIPKDIVTKVLKTNAQETADIYTRKILLGSALSGSMGFNAHHANIIAALFLATGQDLAHVVEGSLGTTTMENIDGDLYVSVSLPSLPLGTVGGGTGLTAQREALSILGINGGGEPPGVNAKKLAEIIAAAVLAGEISLLSALTSKDLAMAHKMLGRGGRKI